MSSRSKKAKRSRRFDVATPRNGRNRSNRIKLQRATENGEPPPVVIGKHHQNGRQRVRGRHDKLGRREQ